MLFDGHLDEEVAVRPAVLAGRPLPFHAERLAVADAGRDGDRQRRLLADDAVAVTPRTGLAVRLALAAAAATGLRLLDATEGRVADGGGLALPVTLRAGVHVGVRRVARAVALRTALGSRDGELLFDPLVGLFEGQIDARAEVLSLPRTVTALAALSARAAAEELVEDVLEGVALATLAAHPSHSAHATHPAGARAAAGSAALLGLLEAVVAHLVVLPASLFVGQHLLSLLHLLELLLGVGFVGDVGVILCGLLAVGLLDLVLGRVARYAEHVVEVLAHSLSGLLG
ncbi:putative glutamate dehydrogenase [Halogeometricum pallidum JCM 14848]|uniref:Putative glutamate dehydrogenase n=1 Tax=Halogeometricum pallidum JCM 14848 TaxID=1227487 RepID=M0DID8_HALPD|nr:putative glutamate dehydrogenase [Halogeometricum pallidum JCM 14848]